MIFLGLIVRAKGLIVEHVGVVVFLTIGDDERTLDVAGGALITVLDDTATFRNIVEVVGVTFVAISF